VVDRGEGWAGLVTSANPHDASSLHGNVALRFAGPAALDLLTSERSVAEWSGETLSVPNAPEEEPGTPGARGRVQLLSEGAIRDALLTTIAASGPGDRLDVAVFYLAHRRMIEALIAAQARGAQVRVLLDPNRNAFGLEKDGIPNRPVAQELVDAGIAVRWCVTQGEQCHSKLLLRRSANGGEAEMIVGSANFTRRNLDNLNLETSVRLQGRAEFPALRDAAAFFERRWQSTPGRITSEPFEAYQSPGLWKQLRYRVMEATGLSTF
ncbi:MAG TPA: phospholipase D-like domain-containing protein, partial [Halomonas sp.]|nr:phospholipase D-like domain-containing protein [Halomonas sp.]